MKELNKILFLVCVLALAGFVATGCAGIEASKTKPNKDGMYRFSGWSYPDKRYQGYNIYLSEYKDKEYRKLNAQPVKAQFYDISNLHKGRTYWWVLSAVTHSGVETQPSKAMKIKIK